MELVIVKKIIVIRGYLASGKSTFATRLSETFNLPCFIKDTFKIALCKNIELHSRAEKSAFSAVTFDAMMFTAEQLMKCGVSLIIEGNFMPTGIKKIDEAGEIRSLVKKYRYDALVLDFSGDISVLYKRFTERESSSERGNVNTVGTISQEVFNTWCHNMDGFVMGDNVIHIDTTDFNQVDFDEYIAEVEKFLKQ